MLAYFHAYPAAVTTKLKYINESTVAISSGVELAAGFADESVILMMVDVDWIVISDADYAGLAVPIVLRCDFAHGAARPSSLTRVTIAT